MLFIGHYRRDFWTASAALPALLIAWRAYAFWSGLTEGSLTGACFHDDDSPARLNRSLWVFIFVLSLLPKGLLRGQAVAIDATTLEANAAMKSIVRKDTGEDWKEYLRGLARTEGIENPTEEDLRRLDRARKDKKVSNQQWESPTDQGHGLPR